MGTPTPPIAIAGGASAARSRLTADRLEPDTATLERLRSACAEVSLDPSALAESGRDWWPLGMVWATEGDVPALPALIARPRTEDEVSAVLAICNEAVLPVTASAGRSGVCGGAVPLHGGVLLDLTGLAGLRCLDQESLTVDLAAGTFGDEAEAAVRNQGFTIGHWPQSMSLSTVGGWLACRSAGQMSNRYGKIEEMVSGLDVTLADGSRITTGGAPRAANGPDLNQLFVGSEGTLGVITAARLRVHPIPEADTSSAWGFATFEAGLEACRLVLRHGGRPAVLRLYDVEESKRNFDLDTTNLLLVHDEAATALVASTESIVDSACEEADRLDPGLVDMWMEHRNDVAALEDLIGKGFVVDTMEVSAPWSQLLDVRSTTLRAMRGVAATIVASVHQSHAYTDGACLYFTFAGRPESDDRESYYRNVWSAATAAALASGASLSHHHGIGLNRAEFMAEALGASFSVLQSVKGALDPRGILNPGKLGLDNPFGGLQ